MSHGARQGKFAKRADVQKDKYDDTEDWWVPAAAKRLSDIIDADVMREARGDHATT